MNALFFALVAALGNLAGGYAVVRHERRSLAVIDGFLAFGAGFMLSVALLEVAPEAIERDTSAPIFLLGGYLAVHLAQHVLVPHFHFGEETHKISPRQGLTALVGLLLHTFFDGVAIASGFQVSGQLGLLLFLAVFLHKLPEGVTMASVMLAGGQSPARALGAAALLGLATVAGRGAHRSERPTAHPRARDRRRSHHLRSRFQSGARGPEPARVEDAGSVLRWSRGVFPYEGVGREAGRVGRREATGDRRPGRRHEAQATA